MIPNSSFNHTFSSNFLNDLSDLTCREGRPGDKPRAGYSASPTVLATKRMTFGSSIRPRLLRWPRACVLQSPFPGSRRSLSLCPRGRGRPWQWEFMVANVGEPAALPGRRPQGFPLGRQPHTISFAPVLVFHSVSLCTAPVSVKPISRCFSTGTKKAEYRSLWLPVPHVPKSHACWSEGTRWW